MMQFLDRPPAEQSLKKPEKEAAYLPHTPAGRPHVFQLRIAECGFEDRFFSIRNPQSLQSCFAALARSDADYVVHRDDEDFAITELASPRCLDNRVDGKLFHVVRDEDLQL